MTWHEHPAAAFGMQPFMKDPLFLAGDLLRN